MPNFYAHIRFCLEVRRTLPPKLRAVLTAEKDTFFCGGFGPDPLYFYTGPKSGLVRSAGLDIHHRSGAAALERFRRPLAEDWPYAKSFASGYLLHYLLDRWCHPYVLEVVGSGEITHFALEGEYDRYLLGQDSLSYQEALPKKDLPEAFYRVASQMAPELTPEIYKRALRDFRWVSLKFGHWAGKPVRHVVNALSHAPRFGSIRGMILADSPGEIAIKHIRALDEKLKSCVEPAAEILQAVLLAAERGRPFDGLNLDYSGNEV